MLHHALRAAAAGAAVMLAVAGANAQTTLDVAVWHNEGSAWSHAYKWWEAEVDKRTGGRVKLKSYYSGSLVKNQEVFKAARDGAIPMGVTSAASISGQIPALSYIEAEAGMPPDVEGHLKAAAALKPLLDEMFRKQRVKYVWMQPSFGGTVNCKDKHLRKPEDWANLKIRTAGRWQAQQMLELNVKPTALDPAEQYIALQNKTVDCVLSNHEITLGLKLYEVAPKITDLRLPVNILIYLANPRTWDRLAENDRKAIEQAAMEAEKMAAEYLFKLQGEIQAKIKAAGGDVYSLNDAERSALVAAMKPTFAKMDAESGADGAAVRKILEPYWR